MASDALTQPNARTFTVVEIVNELLKGRLRVPDFQRPLRWQWEDVRRLFDSMVKGYPIGNLLLWQKSAPEGCVRLGNLEIKAPAFQDAWWVVDGQQRLISIANALADSENGTTEHYALAYDLRTSDFVRPPKTLDALIVPLPVLFDLQRVLRWVVDNPDARERLEHASQVTARLREYKIPAYVVEQQDETTLRDIFDRVNNFGKRLSRAEVFSALHPVGETSSAPTFEAIIARVDAECSFGQLDGQAVLSAILARRGSDFTRDIRAEFKAEKNQQLDFAEESQRDAYERGGAALIRAVKFLQQEAGIPHVSFLPYRYLLVVLTRVFALFPNPEPRNLVLLRRFVWRVAMHGPGVFRGGTTGATRDLASRIRMGDETASISRLLADPLDRSPAKPDLRRFNMKSAEGRVALCALWSLGPRSFLTGTAFNNQQLGAAIATAGALSAVLERVIPREPSECKGWAANRILLLDEAPDGVVDLVTRPPEGWSAKCTEDVWKSHALSAELVHALETGDHGGFLGKRQDLVEQVTSAFVSRMAEIGFEDTPPLDELDLDDEPNA